MENAQKGIALVTGASSGIGAAVARELAQQGWRVVCAARRIDRLSALVEAIGPSAIAIELDIANAQSVETLFERVPEGWRNFAALINCAGHDVGGRRRFDKGSMADWAAIVQTNTIGTMRVTYAVVPGMMERGRGHIVNIGSIAGVDAYAGGAAYAASKFGLNGFTKSILADYRGKGVRVTHVLPGLVRTEFAEARWGDKAKADEFYGKFAVAMEPADIARAVQFAINQPDHLTIAEMVIVPSA